MINQNLVSFVVTPFKECVRSVSDLVALAAAGNSAMTLGEISDAVEAYQGIEYLVGMLRNYVATLRHF